MKEVIEGLAELHGKMLSSSDREVGLVNGFADQLTTMNGRTMTALRQITARHRSERRQIADELNYLAVETLGLPAPAATAAIAAPAPALNEPPAPTRETASRVGGGDWRQAAANIDDDLGPEPLELNGQHQPATFQ